MDYRITDFPADPPGSEHLYTETLLRLSPSFLCYTPPKSSPPPAHTHPSERKEFVMGSFNAVPKLNDKVTDLWALALSTIPGSKLLLKHKSFNDARVEHNFRSRFKAYGLNEERIEIRKYNETTSDHLCAYRKVDVALDPFPYNGTTTTCEALWMGVPVVTLAGDRHSGRVGVSILTNAGLEELIATTPEEYIAILVTMSRDREYLHRLHSRTRQALNSGPVCDSDTFAREFEKAMLNIHTGALKSPPGGRHE
jgi:predicted O-linked N-acetylglucosamine transferase (SPINDLY family)